MCKPERKEPLMVITAWSVLHLLSFPAIPCAATDAQETADAYSAVWQERGRIQSGRFELKRMHRQTGRGGAVLELTDMYVIAVSGPKTKLEVNNEALISRDEDALLGAMPAADRVNQLNDLIASGVVRREHRRVVYVETETQNYLYLEKGRELQIGVNPELAKAAVRFLDVRKLGLFAAPSLKTLASGAVKMTRSAVELVGGRNVIRKEFLGGDTTTIVLIDLDSRATIRVENVLSGGEASAITEIENIRDSVSGTVFPHRVVTRNFRRSGVLADEEIITVEKAVFNLSIEKSEFEPELLRMAKGTALIDVGSQRLIAVWDGSKLLGHPGRKEIDQEARNVIYGIGTRPAQ